MKYDFTSIIDRKGKDAIAVDNIGRKNWGNEPNAPREGFDAIPMWVADMNFATSPSITDALKKRIEHPLYGYFNDSDEFYNAIINWQTKRHGAVGLTKEQIAVESSVHGGVTTVIKALTNPGDNVFLHSPYYMGFDSDVTYIGRNAVFSELKKDENGSYRMDFEDMEKVLKENNVHLAIFCSPHNPAGRVWTKDELAKALAVFEKCDCDVVCDEIWADLIYEDRAHTPMYLMNDWAKEHVVCVYGLGKTFNLAGFAGAYSISFSKRIREKVGFVVYNHLDVLFMHALIGAYNEVGYEWTDELRSVLHENCKYAVEHIRNNYEGVTVPMPEGTYMIFLDCTEYCEKNGISIDELIEAGWDVGVGWQDGRRFRGPCHIRMNLASPYSKIVEAFDRLDKYVFKK